MNNTQLNAIRNTAKALGYGTPDGIRYKVEQFRGGRWCAVAFDLTEQRAREWAGFYRGARVVAM
jgi:hypothetical protein